MVNKSELNSDKNLGVSQSNQEPFMLIDEDEELRRAVEEIENIQTENQSNDSIWNFNFNFERADGFIKFNEENPEIIISIPKQEELESNTRLIRSKFMGKEEHYLLVETENGKKMLLKIESIRLRYTIKLAITVAKAQIDKKWIKIKRIGKGFDTNYKFELL